MHERNDDDGFEADNAAAVAALRGIPDLAAEKARLQALITDCRKALDAVEAASRTTEVHDGVAVARTDEEGYLRFDVAVCSRGDARRALVFLDDAAKDPARPWMARLRFLGGPALKESREQGLFAFPGRDEACACALDWVAGGRKP